jgi:hypothetical protein
MVMEYWAVLQGIVHPDHSALDEVQERRQTALAILFAIAVVETFLNIYFRLQVAKEPFQIHEGTILDDLDKRRSLEYKLSHWPNLLFRKTFDQSAGVGLQFKELKDLRNKLMHFTTSHETLRIGDAELHGVSDISIYHNLTLQDSYHAWQTAHSTIAEILRLSGKTDDQVTREMIHWTAWPAV